MGIGACVAAVNKFAEGPVRIQTERGHTVIDTGPYSIVRHPGYVSAFFLFVGIPLALGSLWAMIPAGLFFTLLVCARSGRIRRCRQSWPDTGSTRQGFDTG